jgi:hypothetical protein
VGYQLEKIINSFEAVTYSGEYTFYSESIRGKEY